jgi:hypothetical protein
MRDYGAWVAIPIFPEPEPVVVTVIETPSVGCSLNQVGGTATVTGSGSGKGGGAEIEAAVLRHHGVRG